MAVGSSNQNRFALYTRNANAWTFQATYTGTGGSGSDQGVAVAVSGNGSVIVSGCTTEAGNVGGIYIFIKSGASYVQQGPVIIGTGYTLFSRQGNAISITDDASKIVVGGYTDNSNFGAAWVFVFNGTTWEQQGPKLTGSLSGNALFGFAVSIASLTGDVIAIGSPLLNSSVGAVFVFTRTSGVWLETGVLISTEFDVGVSPQQGKSVAISENGLTLAVGAGAVFPTGNAWVYFYSGGSWSRQGGAIVGLSSVDPSTQGKSIALSSDGNRMALAGPDDNSGFGAIWLFIRYGTSWLRNSPKITGTSGVRNTGNQIQQGLSLSMSGDGQTVAFGGPFNNNTGGAWVNMYSQYTGAPTFLPSKVPSRTPSRRPSMAPSAAPSRNPTPPTTLSPTLAPSFALITTQKVVGTPSASSTPTTSGTRQGESVAISNDTTTLVVGAYGDSSNKGATYIFNRTGNSYVQTNKLVGTGSADTTQEQGASVAVSADGNTVASGARVDGSSGSVYVFTRNVTSFVWSQQARITVPNAIGAARVGVSVALSTDGNTLAFGGESDNSGVGAAWVYIRNASLSWVYQAKLIGIGTTGAAALGISVSLSDDGDTLAVGAWADNSNTGAAFIFVRIGTSWSQEDVLFGSGSTGLTMGRSVSLTWDGNILATGGSNNGGGIWVFTRSGLTWSQQARITATDNITLARQGVSTSITKSGSHLLFGGPDDGGSVGAAWLYRYLEGTWYQLGPKITFTTIGDAQVGRGVSISPDARVLAVGGITDNNGIGATWVQFY